MKACKYQLVNFQNNAEIFGKQNFLIFVYVIREGQQKF